MFRNVQNQFCETYGGHIFDLFKYFIGVLSCNISHEYMTTVSVMVRGNQAEPGVNLRPSTVPSRPSHLQPERQPALAWIELTETTLVKDFWVVALCDRLSPLARQALTHFVAMLIVHINSDIIQDNYMKYNIEMYNIWHVICVFFPLIRLGQSVQLSLLHRMVWGSCGPLGPIPPTPGAGGNQLPEPGEPQD